MQRGTCSNSRKNHRVKQEFSFAVGSYSFKVNIIMPDQRPEKFPVALFY